MLIQPASMQPATDLLVNLDVSVAKCASLPDELALIVDNSKMIIK